jgi:hypothetical protein
LVGVNDVGDLPQIAGRLAMLITASVSPSSHVGHNSARSNVLVKCSGSVIERPLAMTSATATSIFCSGRALVSLG